MFPPPGNSATGGCAGVRLRNRPGELLLLRLVHRLEAAQPALQDASGSRGRSDEGWWAQLSSSLRQRSDERVDCNGRLEGFCGTGAKSLPAKARIRAGSSRGSLFAINARRTDGGHFASSALNPPEVRARFGVPDQVPPMLRNMHDDAGSKLRWDTRLVGKADVASLPQIGHIGGSAPPDPIEVDGRPHDVVGETLNRGLILELDSDPGGSLVLTGGSESISYLTVIYSSSQDPPFEMSLEVLSSASKRQP
jgi:hypothetical protein